MKVLIVIDMQKDFTTGVLGNAQTAAAVPNVVNRIKEYKREYPQIPVLYTMDTHDENYLETQEGKKLPVPHCIEGTWGWTLDENIGDVINENDIMVKKHTFGANELPCAINENLGSKVSQIDEFEIMGVCTDICVISNAMLLKAFYPNIPIKVNSKCCAGVTPESHENALKAMTACQIEII